MSETYYKRIYDFVKNEIVSGKLNIGDKIPSEKELCEQFAVSRITSKKALELLAGDGFIFRLPGKGTFVADADANNTGQKTPAHTIGFLMPGLTDAFGTQLLYAISETCETLGYHLILKHTKDSAEEEKKALQSLSDTDVAGILVIPAHGEYYNAEILNQILKKRPLVFVDRHMKGLPVPSVSTDNTAAAELGVEYLLRLGHRHIAFYSGPVEYNSSVEDRQQGFIRAFADYGITLDSALLCTNLSEDRYIEIIRQHLADHPEITAAFAAEFAIAQFTKNASESLGLTIPDNFSIMSIDSTSAIGVPLFTHLQQDEREIGRRAVESLHSIITGTDPASIGDIRIPARLVIGGSVGEFRE
jgi:DNA-binding LacI/PurR family transcriptional regulator